MGENQHITNGPNTSEHPNHHKRATPKEQQMFVGGVYRAKENPIDDYDAAGTKTYKIYDVTTERNMGRKS